MYGLTLLLLVVVVLVWATGSYPNSLGQEAQRRREALMSLPRRQSSRQQHFKERAAEMTRQACLLSFIL